jgi:SAM-dependent methyltransferase
MHAIDVVGFEKKFRAHIDPWNYTNSRFEHFKRGVLLRACGPSKRGRVLELGCAIGETSRCLARLSLRLIAVDASSTALAEAARRTRHLHNITFRRAVVPQQMPWGQFDLIVVSELIYYLRAHQLRRLADQLLNRLAPGGIIVLLNHRGPFDDASVLPSLAHRDLRRRFARHLRILRENPYFRFDVAVFQHSRPKALQKLAVA